MYLIDSSAWIEYLRPHGSAKVKERVRAALQREEACCCGIVMVEVLRGAKNEKDWALLHESLGALPQLPLDEEAIERASRWAYQLDRKGKTLSTTDLLIASSAYEKATLVHVDSDFKMITSIADLDQEHL